MKFVLIPLVIMVLVIIAALLLAVPRDGIFRSRLSRLAAEKSVAGAETMRTVPYRHAAGWLPFIQVKDDSAA